MEINFGEAAHVWDNFLSASPQRSVFVESQFLESLGIKYDLVTCYDKNNIAAGAVILYSASDTPILTPFPFTMYQGVLLADNYKMKPHSRISYEHKITKYFIDQLIYRYGKVCFCQSWRFADMRPFQWHNYHEAQKGRFRLDLHYTGILDIGKYKDFEEYWSTIRAVRRQEFNKAVEKIRIEQSNDLILFDSLYKKTFERQGITIEPDRSILVNSIVTHALKSNYGNLQIAFLNDKPVSAALFLYDDRTAYYLFGATDPDYRNTFGGTFLLEHLIKDAFERNIAEVDFVGVNSPSRGDYKISFNADLKPYFTASFGAE